MASAELLQNDPSIQSPFLKQVLEDVRDEVKKMTKLVSDLLVVARSDNKALKLKPQKFDLAGLIEQTSRLMQPLADQKHITLNTYNLEKTEIQADEQKIRQLILILVDNAVKYTPEEGSVTVSLLKAEKGRVKFAVADTGIGIGRENHEKVFESFFKVDAFKQGMGLGLTMARKTAERLGGTLTLDAAYTEGARFVLVLPGQLGNGQEEELR
jgi:signal transduction histidine kinase